MADKKTVMTHVIYLLLILVLSVLVIRGFITERKLLCRIDLLKQGIYAVLYKQGAVDDETASLLSGYDTSLLIPFKGVLGGIPHWIGKDNLYGINDNQLLAVWEDGHIGGFVIIEKDRNGPLGWKTVEGWCDYDYSGEEASAE
jgi:hypothetical protein